MVKIIEIVAPVALIAILSWIAAYGRRKNLTEARFDSKTGKEIE